MEVDTIRAHIALMKLTAESSVLQTELKTQRRLLAALWGEKEAPEFEVADELFGESEIESEEHYLEQVSSHPGLRLPRKDIERIRSNIALLRAEAVPDITVSAGYIRNTERGENASKLGLSGEIPLFNRNRDAIRGEEFRASAREQEMENDVIGRRIRIRTLLDRLKNKDQVYEIEKDIVKASQSAYDMMLKHYEQGVVDFLSVSEALTDLLEHKNEMVNLRLERELFRVELCLVSNACFK
jgi:cobalt-zinc-cadmium efflux system outer membrane protein